MTTSSNSRPGFVRPWLLWTAGFISFPISGLAGTAVAGRVDGPVAAVLGGIVCGLVLGAGQVLVSRGRLDPFRWVPATAAGMGAGLLLGAVAVDFATSLPALVAMGALTGVLLGVAQAVALPSRTRLRWAWAAAVPVLWALGWAATTLGGISVEDQFTIFGAYGAVTFMALSGLLLHYLLPVEANPGQRSSASRVGATS
jgi:hypothetical protein